MIARESKVCCSFICLLPTSAECMWSRLAVTAVGAAEGYNVSC